jgi:hypothetical protein
VLREAQRAPLVLFRLFPLSVRIVTAAAFNDGETAQSLHAEQLSILPAIADCSQCHGGLLKPGAKCATCGNPLWKFKWLTAID